LYSLIKSHFSDGHIPHSIAPRKSSTTFFEKRPNATFSLLVFKIF